MSWSWGGGGEGEKKRYSDKTKEHLALAQQLSESEKQSVPQVRRQWRSMCVLVEEGETFQVRTEFVMEEAWFSGLGL